MEVRVILTECQFAVNKVDSARVQENSYNMNETSNEVSTILLTRKVAKCGL